MNALGWLVVGAAPWLLLLVVSRIDAAIGRAGLVRLGGEGDQMNGDTVVRNSGDSAAPSLPEKRLFMVGRRGPRKRPLHVVTLYGASYVSTDSGLPVSLAKYIDGGTT